MIDSNVLQTQMHMLGLEVTWKRLDKAQVCHGF